MGKAVSKKFYIIIFISVCAIAYIGVKKFQHEWGSAYSDEISKNPQQAEWYYFRGCTRIGELILGKDAAGWSDNMTDEEKKEKAKLTVADFSKCIELAPSFGTAYYHRALLKNEYDLEDATADFQKAAELVPADVRIHREFGNYLNRKQRRQDAEREWQIAQELDPKGEY